MRKELSRTDIPVNFLSTPLCEPITAPSHPFPSNYSDHPLSSPFHYLQLEQAPLALHVYTTPPATLKEQLGTVVKTTAPFSERNNGAGAIATPIARLLPRLFPDIHPPSSYYRLQATYYAQQPPSPFDAAVAIPTGPRPNNGPWPRACEPRPASFAPNLPRSTRPCSCCDLDTQRPCLIFSKCGKTIYDLIFIRHHELPDHRQTYSHLHPLPDGSQPKRSVLDEQPARLYPTFASESGRPDRWYQCSVC